MDDGLSLGICLRLEVSDTTCRVFDDSERGNRLIPARSNVHAVQSQWSTYAEIFLTEENLRENTGRALKDAAAILNIFVDDRATGGAYLKEIWGDA